MEIFESGYITPTNKILSHPQQSTKKSRRNIDSDIQNMRSNNLSPDTVEEDEDFIEKVIKENKLSLSLNDNLSNGDLEHIQKLDNSSLINEHIHMEENKREKKLTYIGTSFTHNVVNQDLIDGESEDIENIDMYNESLGSLNLANCDWGYNSGKILNPQMDRYSRRKLRKPLTEMYCKETLYNFFMSLLYTALEFELEKNDETYHYYAFDPYNKSVSDKLDKFSQLSYERKIGIKTKLSKESANILLSCYYVLYNNFELTSDEIIFEDLYREGVLMQDSNFELAKFYERITTKELEHFEPLKSLLAECLELKVFPDRKLQFNTWKITYSKQIKEVKSEDENKLKDYKTIFELISYYDESWFQNENKSLIEKFTSCHISQSKYIEISSSSIKGKEIKISPLDNDFEFTPLLTKDVNIPTVPSTPIKSKNKGIFHKVDKLIGKFLGYYKDKDV